MLLDTALVDALRRCEQKGQPVLLLGTTIAFLHLFETMAKSKEALTLPADSRILDTGGMKSENREVSRLEFIRLVHQFFGIPEKNCVNEYGMCEMSSQFYGHGASLDLVGPPWTRTLIIDPLSGLPISDNRPGLLRHFDLANVDSIMAIQTDDVGVRTGTGFTYIGRDSRAEEKGCSLSIGALLSREDR